MDNTGEIAIQRKTGLMFRRNTGEVQGRGNWKSSQEEKEEEKRSNDQTNST